MKKAQRRRAGLSENTSDAFNVSPPAEKSKKTDDLARRDAAAMVYILNRMRSGMESFEHVYESLKRLHGPPFEKHFRDALTQKREERDE
jgi:hypothetical protein